MLRRRTRRGRVVRAAARRKMSCQPRPVCSDMHDLQSVLPGVDRAGTGSIADNSSQLVARGDTLPIVRNLQALERLLGNVDAHRHRLETVRGEVKFSSCRDDAARYLVTIQQYIESLREAVIGRDGLGDVVDSLTELATRAIRFVVLTELKKLDNIR